MCEPAYLSMGVTALGTYMSMKGQTAGGQDKANYYNTLAGQNYKEAADVQEAAVKDITGVQGQAALTTTAVERNAAKVSGAQRAALAASGVGGGSVTAEDVAKDTATTLGRDKDAIRYNADIKSYEIGTQATLRAKALRDQAVSFGQAGVNAIKAAGLGATSSLLSGAGTVADQWYRYRQTSAGGSPKVPSLANWGADANA
jgi:hypothetical protein